jgi:hypothetical protein
MPHPEIILVIVDILQKTAGIIRALKMHTPQRTATSATGQLALNDHSNPPRGPRKQARKNNKIPEGSLIAGASRSEKMPSIASDGMLAFPSAFQDSMVTGFIFSA